MRRSADIRSSTASDGELARAIASAPAGAAQAEESELYGRFARRVRLYGLKHLRDDAAADDLVQEVLLVTIERLRAGEVRNPDEIGSFILGTSRMFAGSFPAHWDPKLRIPRGQVVAAASIVSPKY